MENKIRFRNHISVILEQLGATFGILFVLSFTNIDDVIDYIEKGSSEELSLTVYIGGCRSDNASNYYQYGKQIDRKQPMCKNIPHIRLNRPVIFVFFRIFLLKASFLSLH